MRSPGPDPVPAVPAGERCRAITSAGRRCRNAAVDERGFCRAHAGPPGGPTPVEEEPAPQRRLAEQLRGAAEFLSRRLTGSYEVDEFGFDPDLTDRVLHPLAMLMFRRYWRIKTIGIVNVPETGPALLVANHSGTLPWDALMMQFGLREEHPAHRHVRLLAADLALTFPAILHLARKSGNVVAAHEDALRLLRSGELVGVFPEGYKGLGKPFRERYRLQRFGRGGFVEVALRTRTPIVPVAIIGAEEIYPMIADFKPVARLFGLPYFPVTPFFPALGLLGATPLPSKWLIEYGAPIATDGYEPEAYEDTMLVLDLTDRVRDTIQQMINRNRAVRRGFFG